MSISREVLAKYVKPGCTFIESGSRYGITLLRATEAGAGIVIGCEVDGLYAGTASALLADYCPEGNAFVEHMPSERMFLESYTADVVFLDAHTDTYSPIMKELELIERWPNKPKAILIDDLRCMAGWGVLVDRLQGKLLDMGYRVSYEDGVEPRDIMVGTLAS